MNDHFGQVGQCDHDTAGLLTRVLFLPSQGDSQVENREHHGPAIISEQVSYNGGRDGRVAGFSDTHESSGENKQPVVLQRQRKKRSRVSPFGFLIENVFKKRYCLHNRHTVRLHGSVMHR